MIQLFVYHYSDGKACPVEASAPKSNCCEPLRYCYLVSYFRIYNILPHNEQPLTMTNFIGSNMDTLNQNGTAPWNKGSTLVVDKVGDPKGSRFMVPETSNMLNNNNMFYTFTFSFVVMTASVFLLVTLTILAILVCVIR